MKITNVKIRKVDNNTKMKGIASIAIDNNFVIHGIKIIESQNGFFIAMPSKRNEDGTFSDIAHPINSNTRNYIQDMILEAYNNNIEG
jgi:stage V sporulation protein G